MTLVLDASLFGSDGQRSWGVGRGNYYNNPALIDIAGSERTEYMRQSHWPHQRKIASE